MKNKSLKELRIKIKKDFGKKCGLYEPLCSCCRAWESLEILECLYFANTTHDKKVSKKKEFDVR